MSAQMVQIDLEPHGLGNDLLEEWGAWNKDDGDGRASWNVKPRIGKVHAGRPPDRVELVERILAPMRVHEPKRYKVIEHRYRREYSIWLLAREMGQTEAEVSNMLWHACGIVEREYADATEA